MIEHASFDVFRWIMNEMIGFVDECIEIGVDRG